ncbi:DUF3828 domain-containing protein [Xanthomonas oryzae pv. oryzae]|nr:DUF3828 domain-containing protein [Xanthomonas oryzae]AXM21387.1 DUF3828 domain-containing protein [Xanthomonas oryzae pv. oryzae]AXX67636.1 hypothetical protein B4599_13300 [Xanthomonas oryzae pv. oryzae]QBN98529.1 DUF3828 domain-containing protein [Xanthomonas oryzae pv. oryzae]RBB50601.1 DUF3828 domain-containing protein [Xanthomonas oryzae pv. oryzae]RBB87638.1 DUF3828 domain-containing protein [Xanthomonas oryzae pv. oryzae]
MKIKFLKYFKFHLIFIFYICFYPLAFSEDNGPEQLIIKIYHDYAWVAVIGDQWKGEGISSQKLPVLQKYFDYRLAALLEKDNECNSRGGRTCNLDFDPIFASQDPAVYDLRVGNLKNNESIDVEFKYPENHERILVKYVVVNSGSGWRVKDICYQHKSCLSTILSVKEGLNNPSNL